MALATGLMALAPRLLAVGRRGVMALGPRRFLALELVRTGAFPRP